MRKTTVWPLCSILVMSVVFFDESKIPTSLLCRIPQGTFIPSLVPISPVVSKEKNNCIIVNDDDDGWQTPCDGNSSKMLKWGKNSNMILQIYKKKDWSDRSHHAEHLNLRSEFCLLDCTIRSLISDNGLVIVIDR